MADCVEMEGIHIIESKLATASYVSNVSIILLNITNSSYELVLISPNV